MNLQDKTLLITGGTSGIGYALVKQLSSTSKSIVVIARNSVHLEKLKNEFPNVHIYKCALANKIDLEKIQ
jgi:short-subunit dehydrogenase involved in D-alanine esterification of teichoic acids